MSSVESSGATSAPPPSSSSSGDSASQYRAFLSQLGVLNDVHQKDEAKLKAAQELADSLDAIVASPHYQQFLDHAIKAFVNLLKNGRPQFIAETNVQQLRKQVLEMIQRLPANDFLRPYAKVRTSTTETPKTILTMCFLLRKS